VVEAVTPGRMTEAQLLFQSTRTPFPGGARSRLLDTVARRLTAL
jgi:hypothetical protein